MTEAHVHDLRDHLPARYAHTRAEDIPPEVVTAAFDRVTRIIWRAYRGEGWSRGGAGAVLRVPPGRWRLEPSRGHRRAGLVLDAPGTTLQGSGIRATIVELDSPEPAHTIAGGGVVVGRVRVDTLPVPRWNGAVVQAAPDPREQGAVRRRALPTPNTPDDGWYAGALDAGVAGSSFTGRLWKNKALVVIERGRVTLLEFELQGEGPGWLGEPTPESAGLLVVGGPAVRELALEDQVLSGTFPMQIVQVSRDPATTGTEVATRVWPTVRAVLQDGILDGTFTLEPESGIRREFRCGFRLRREDRVEG